MSQRAPVASNKPHTQQALRIAAHRYRGTKRVSVKLLGPRSCTKRVVSNRAETGCLANDDPFRSPFATTQGRNPDSAQANAKGRFTRVWLLNRCAAIRRRFLVASATATSFVPRLNLAATAFLASQRLTAFGLLWLAAKWCSGNHHHRLDHH